MNQQGIEHQNLRPEHIYISQDQIGEDPKIKILGFSQHKKTLENEDFNYNAPSFERYDKDVWCLGIILFRMMTHQMPFKTATDLQSDAPFDSLQNTGYSKELITLVKQLLSRAERPTFASLTVNLLKEKISEDEAKLIEQEN